VPLHDGVKVAVNVTLWPTVELVGEALIEVVLAWTVTTAESATTRTTTAFFTARRLFSPLEPKTQPCETPDKYQRSQHSHGERS
jgi:hypothetical protein